MHYIFLDINECHTNPCDVNANCTNIDGGYECSCHMGYEGDGTSCAGTRLNETSARKTICHFNQH